MKKFKIPEKADKETVEGRMDTQCFLHSPHCGELLCVNCVFGYGAGQTEREKQFIEWEKQNDTS